MMVDLGKQLSDVPESEKAADMRELYNFLKRPFDEVQPDRPTCDAKRNKLSSDANNPYSTPSRVNRHEER